MNKAHLSYIASIIISMVAMLVLRRLGVHEAIAFGMGWLCMMLVGYPFTRHITEGRVSLARWSLSSAMAAATITILYALWLGFAR